MGAQDIKLCFDFIKTGRGFFYLVEYMEKEKKATIKQRRAVADLLAVASGRKTRGAADLEKAGKMSDSEILQFLHDNTPAAVEVEEIRPNENGATVPADAFGFCLGLVNDFCDKFDIDKKTMSPLQWGACCSYIGRGFSSRSAFRVESDNFIKGSNKKIDAQAVAELLPVWADLCGLLNKTPLPHDFANFCGLSWDWVYKLENNADGVTADDIGLYKRVLTICRGGLDSRLIDGKAAPVGAIFYAKAKQGYKESTTIQHEYINGAGSSATLPDFGSFKQLPDKSD